VPPGYQAEGPAAGGPKSTHYTGILDRDPVWRMRVGEEEADTSKRIFERCCDEHGYSAGFHVVKD